MAASLPPSLSDIVDEAYDDLDDAETMTAAQVLAKLEEVFFRLRITFDLVARRPHSPQRPCTIRERRGQRQRTDCRPASAA